MRYETRQGQGADISTANGAAQAKQDPATIMVVEDEFVIALDLQHMLEDDGHNVLGPHVSVSQALCDLADEGRMPDAAILDVQLDGEDVMLLAEQLRLKQVPIIFHSGHAKPEDLERRFPGSFFCAKPCTAERLNRTVRDALEG